jgi:hypothetical protein
MKARATLRYVAIAGDVLFLLWIVRNGFDDGFRAGLVELVSWIGLLGLLALNAVLLWGGRERLNRRHGEPTFPRSGV